MNLIKRSILSAALLTALFGAKAQMISFPVETHNFGTIQEVNGDVSHEFNFTNTGESALVIHRVVTTCGCTTPEWTKTPIAPGKSGSIRVTYDPSNRPGVIDKGISVYSNSKKGVVRLRIKGSVAAKKEEAREPFPIKMGDLHLKSNSMNFHEIGKTEEKTSWIEVTNVGKETIDLSFSHVPPHLYLQANPQRLAPNQLGMIFITFFAKKLDDWGDVSTRFGIVINNDSTQMAERQIALNATIIERFANVNSEQAPKIVYSEPVVSFGKINAREKKSQRTVVYNRGKSELAIRKLVPSSDAVGATLDAKTIPAGGKATLRVMVDASKMRGKSEFREEVKVICNDPATPTSSLQLFGNIL